MIKERPPEVVRLAQRVANGSIVAQATERLIYQIVEVCAEHEKEKVEALRAQNAELVAALEEIASLEGKTLYSMDMGQPYSIGAARAFDQCADIARAARAAAGHKQGSGK
jgi:molybdopterin biosynthesis enzyme